MKRHLARVRPITWALLAWLLTAPAWISHGLEQIGRVCPYDPASQSYVCLGMESSAGGVGILIGVYAAGIATTIGLTIYWFKTRPAHHGDPREE